MFKNLATGTKLFILCGVFIVALAVPISELFIEQKAAIRFARIELSGVHYLSALDKVYRHPTFYEIPDGVGNI